MDSQIVLIKNWFWMVQMKFSEIIQITISPFLDIPAARHLWYLHPGHGAFFGAITSQSCVPLRQVYSFFLMRLLLKKPWKTNLKQIHSMNRNYVKSLSAHYIVWRAHTQEGIREVWPIITGVKFKEMWEKKSHVWCYYTVH